MVTFGGAFTGTIGGSLYPLWGFVPLLVCLLIAATAALDIIVPQGQAQSLCCVPKASCRPRNTAFPRRR
jgi:hypothetical protein